MRFKNVQNDAVSPVVGIMLMLVVTIIVAAVVAVFASGVVTTTNAASNVIISVDGYQMGTIDQGNNTDTKGYKDGCWDFGSSLSYGNYYANSSYAPYSMTLVHKGGESLNIGDLILLITYNSATYNTAFSDVTDANKFEAGDHLVLAVNTTKMPSSNLKYGLSQQSMFGVYDTATGTILSPPASYSFKWAITDKTGYVIAEGTESTRYNPQNVA